MFDSTVIMCADAPHCPLYVSYGTDKENQFNNHELLQILINFFILVILCLIHQQRYKEKLDATHSEG